MTNVNPPPSILVLEDNLALSRLYAKVLNQAGCHVYLAQSVKDARALLLSDEKFDIFLCDLQIGQELSLDLLRESKALPHQTQLQTIVVTGSGRFQLFAEELSSVYFLEKPVDINMLHAMITRVLATPKLQTLKI